VPESKSRKKKVRPSDPDWLDRMAKAEAKERVGNPSWLMPVMVGLMVVGLVWVVMYYVTSPRVGGGFPIPPLGTWNLAVGFVLIIAGFVLTMRWK
jgi:hypothetical protein